MAFNEAFRRKGLDHEWSLEQYGVLLETGGGKERMDAYFSQCADREPWASITGAAPLQPEPCAACTPATSQEFVCKPASLTAGAPCRGQRELGFGCVWVWGGQPTGAL